MNEIPPVIPRRLYEDQIPGGYMESDRDYMENNRDACIWFLDNATELKRELEILRKKSLQRFLDIGELEEEIIKLRNQIWIQKRKERS